MPFDLATATPVEDSAGGGFDLASAKPIKRLSPAERARIEAETAAWQQSVSPTADMNAFQRFAAAYGKVGADIALGMRSVLPESIGGTKPGEVAERKRLDEPLMRTPAGAIGNVVGNLAAYAPIAAAPGANTVAGAAGYGALAGALQSAESWGERGRNAMTSGGMSGGLMLVPNAALALWNAAVAPFTKGGQQNLALATIDRFAGGPGWQSKMGAAEFIPGSKRTLAEVTGNPGIAQLQRAAQAASPETANAMDDLRTARLSARKDALLKIAGDSGEKEFFEAARDATAERLYGQAFKAPLDPKDIERVRPRVERLLSRPSIQAAKADAIRIAREAEDSIGEEGSLKHLHYMKKALDDDIAKAMTAGNKGEASRLMDTQKKLLSVMDDLSPAYKNARAEYAAASKPINRMEVGQFMYDKLIPGLSDLGAERITPNEFAKTLKLGDGLAKKATGFKGAKLDDILTGPERDTLVNLGLDIGGEVGAMERGKVPGSPTAQYLAGANAMRSILGPLGMPRNWSEGLAGSAVGRTLGSITTKFPFNVAERDVQSRLGNFLVNPDQAVAARAALATRNARLAPVNNAMRYALPGATIPAGVEAAQQ